MKKTLIASIALLSSLALHGNAIATSIADLNLSGSATKTDNALQLTTVGVQNAVGSAFSSSVVDISKKFSTSFSFQFSGGDTNAADGLVFVIKNASSTALGAYGGGIGYGGYLIKGVEGVGIPKSVGIEFDSWYNPERGDPNSNHIGIDINGNSNSIKTLNISPTFNGTDTWYSWVDYDGTVLSVSVNQSGVKPGTAMLSENVDIKKILGSSSALMGFTASTGGVTQTTRLLSFSESAPNPEPSTYVLMSVGAIIIGIAARRKKLIAG